MGRKQKEGEYGEEPEPEKALQNMIGHSPHELIVSADDVTDLYRVCLIPQYSLI